MRKLIFVVLTLSLFCNIFCFSASAESQSAGNERIYMLATPEGVAKVSKEQYDYVIHSSDRMVAFNSLDLQIEPIEPSNTRRNSNESYSIVRPRQNSYAHRAYGDRGVWDIEKITIESGQTMFYYKPGKEWFEVAYDDVMEISINVFNARMRIGIEGDNGFDVPKEEYAFSGLTLGVIIREEEGTLFRAYVTNKKDSDVSITGYFQIYD